MNYLYLSIILFVLGIVGVCEIKNNGLEKTIVKLEQKNKDIIISYGTCKANKATLENAILKQNSKIKEFKLDMRNSQKEIDRLNSLPPKVRYKTIYKTVYKGASNECEDIKNILDSVRNYTP